MSEQETPEQIIEYAIDRYRPSHIFGLFSGGHDSLCACHVLSGVCPEFTAVHINTGIGVDETRQFVRDTCRKQRWPLKEYHPPIRYEELVVDHGFPGPGHHMKMYQRLKERCLRQVLREHGKRSRKVLFVSGRRAAESKRRMANCQHVVEVGPYPSNRAVWVNPLMSWTAIDKREYMQRHGLPKNPVVERLCMSGECLCGAFAEEGELEYIRRWYPNTAAEIDRISARVKNNGKHHIWGTRPGKVELADEAKMAMCHSCSAKRQNRSESG